MQDSLQPGTELKPRVHSNKTQRPVRLSKSNPSSPYSVRSGRWQRARCSWSNICVETSLYWFSTPGRAICTFPECIPRNRWIKFNYLFWLNLIRFLSCTIEDNKKGIPNVIHLLRRSRELLPQKNGSSERSSGGMRVKVSYYYTSEPAEHRRSVFWK